VIGFGVVWKQLPWMVYSADLFVTAYSDPTVGASLLAKTIDHSASMTPVHR
jgi:hypothetical protein